MADPIPPLLTDEQLAALGDLSKLETNDLLRKLVVEMYRNNAIMLRQAPNLLDWAVFPTFGGFATMQPGTTVFDLEQGQVTNPDGSSQRLPADVQFYHAVQSMLFATDAPVQINIDPSGQGQFLSNLNYIIHGRARTARFIRLTALWPYLLILVFATSLDPPLVIPGNLGMSRYTDYTLTDSTQYVTIPFVAVSTGQPIPPTSQGFGTIPTTSVGTRLFTVRNEGPGSVRVRLQGAGFELNADALDAAGLTGWVLDTDVHAPGGPNATSVTIASGHQALLESGLPFEFIRLQGQPTLSTASARLIIDMHANVATVR